jgi:protein-disulfide isomerase
MFNLKSLATLAFALVASATADYTSPIPLSKTSNSFTRGDLSSPITVDFWIDLACSDTMNNWPIYQEVYAQYESKVKFAYHLFPLPYHQFAFLLNKSANVVSLASKDADDVFRFFDASFEPENQAKVYNSATGDVTYNMMLQTVGQMVTNATSLDLDKYLDEMANNEDAEMNTRYGWKEAAMKSVIGSPITWINQVPVDGLESIEDWNAALDSMLM